LQYTFQDLKYFIYREDFPVDDEIIDEECKNEKEYHPFSAK
jgi:hypothetical protein